MKSHGALSSGIAGQDSAAIPDKRFHASLVAPQVSLLAKYVAIGRNTVVILPEKAVPLREVARTGRFVVSIPKLEVKFAVVEIN